MITDRAAAEARMQAVIAPILAAAQDPLADALAAEDEDALTAALAAMLAALRRGVVVVFYDLMLAEVLALADAAGATLDDAALAAALAQEASTQAERLTDQVGASTRRALAQIAATRPEDGWTAAEAGALVALLTSERRAETIAITETTTAASLATILALPAVAAALGTQPPRLINRTAADDRVCSICLPLDGATQEAWPNPNGPPWHPRCRCDIEEAP